MTPRTSSALSLVAALATTVGLYLLVACSDDSVTETVAPEPATATAATAPSAADADADGGAKAEEADAPPEGRPELLSAWGQLDLVDGQLRPANGVVPYTLNSALFSDYARKLRTVWLPAGAPPGEYDADAVFSFPVGTVITKTFWYPVAADGADNEVLKDTSPDDLTAPLDLAQVRLVETRVLVHRADGWDALPYVWNDDQTEATLQRTGDLQSLTLVERQTDAETPFVYVVPDVNQCAACHAENHSTRETQPIGPKARHLNLDVDLGEGPQSQLVAWQALGLLGDTPDPADIPMTALWNDEAVLLDDRARAYLDINCAHCHNADGAADTSGLLLEVTAELGVEMGVCKPPVAAGTGTGGRLVGISPGSADDSIFIFRMTTSDPASMMPEVGRSIPHTEGVDLISTWIDSLAGSC